MRRADRRMRRRCAELVRDLVLSDPFDLDDVVAQVSTARGRPIRLLPMNRGAWHAVCGVWVTGESEDFIFVDGQATGVHREHIVLHELAHMLCGHRSGLAESRFADVSALVPDLDPETIRRVLARSDYEDDQEREAELLASMLRGRAGVPPPPLTSSAAEELAARPDARLDA
ncbi:hypothetical protein ACIB24_13825 [Spongisporangium articulatum]|uniref:IrrE N-terminal-like domain-containing protein n=1 Tax=Spongisporangium articulatum TaxID=3362603 RepID=A0ABW8AQD0_9ACTN